MTQFELGLKSIETGNWKAALVYLHHAARQIWLKDPQALCQNLQLLDLLGEAAYRTKVPEALSPYQNFYKYPRLATQMARAFLMLGDTKSCDEFLEMASESPLKHAIFALRHLNSDVVSCCQRMRRVAVAAPRLDYPEFWRALAAVADANNDLELLELAELNSKIQAYDDPNIHFNQSLRLLAKGDFRAAWRLYEARLLPGAHQPPRRQLGKISVWEGESLVGKSLLIFLEQGLGDGLFSLRYLQHFIQSGVEVEVVARPGLLNLIRSSFPNIRVRNEDEVAHVDYWDQEPRAPDFWVYSLSIPYRANLPNPKFTQGYLQPRADLVQEAKARLAEINHNGLPVFVINWRGRVDTDSDRTRAFSLKEFIESTGLCNTPCVLVIVQLDRTEEELEYLRTSALSKGWIILDVTKELNDFEKTASWIKAAENLLTCDTSVAHLGGALGCATTVFVRNRAIWQWITKDSNQNDEPTVRSGPSAWYDSVKIQIAMAPEISWMFTTTKEIPNERSSKPSQIRPTNQDAEQRPRVLRFAGRPSQDTE